MYRINVLDPGKFHNITVGYRYCFFKKSAKELIDLFLGDECAIKVEKLIRVTRDIFAWSEAIDDKVVDYWCDKVYEKEEEEED